MIFREYQEEDLPSLHRAFVSAFSTNQTPINLSLEDFSVRLHKKLKLEPSVSFVCLDNDDIVGFNLHTIGTYEEMITAYNGGMGTVPSYRKKGVAENLYIHTLGALGKYKVARVILEVVTTNKPALTLYTHIGFQFRRMLKCFRLMATDLRATTRYGVYQVSEIPDLGTFDFSPGYIDDLTHIDASYETILRASIGEETLGYVVFQPLFGRISQIMVRPDFRRKGVATSLIAEASVRSRFPLTIMNIPDDQFQMIHALERLGFKNEIDQFEMELII